MTSEDFFLLSGRFREETVTAVTPPSSPKLFFKSNQQFSFFFVFDKTEMCFIKL